MLKEYVLEKDYCKSIITKYGSYSDENKPKVIYLRTKAKIEPLTEKMTFENDIDNIKKEFLIYINKEILKNKSLQDTYLSNIEISSKSVKFGKVSFLRYDLYLKPRVIRTLEKNIKSFTKLSSKFDKKLIKLLKKQGINCI